MNHAKPSPQAVRRTLVELLDQLEAVRDELPGEETRRRADILLSGREHLERLDDRSLEDYRVAVEAFCYKHDRHDVFRASGIEHAYNYRERYPQQPRQPLDRLDGHTPANAFGCWAATSPSRSACRRRC